MLLKTCALFIFIMLKTIHFFLHTIQSVTSLFDNQKTFVPFNIFYFFITTEQPNKLHFIIFFYL